eukprot:CAMPEP_0116550670 /NCGR_PEP_ID=MMETSP0397-20121206/5552_1 /TAXON_ID=216820 /ORGANISM="Cyclophora tenuis, Strain ECT3854" /LENGTH=40 /DNA_ID= /DNA_START= /DNA_END= /DNA_ORIENTATION=
MAASASSATSRDRLEPTSMEASQISLALRIVETISLALTA